MAGLIIAGLVLVLYAVGVWHESDPASRFLPDFGIFLIVLGIIGASLIPPLFRKREDLRMLLSQQSGQHGWGFMMTAGLRAFTLSARPSLTKSSLESSGYLLLGDSGFEFWQRRRGILTCVLTIRRDSVSSVESGLVSFGFQSQQGVLVHVRMDSGAIETVPLAVQGMLGPWQTWPKAAEQIISGWSTNPS